MVLILPLFHSPPRGFLTGFTRVFSLSVEIMGVDLSEEA
jgi:hypothetical protein